VSRSTGNKDAVPRFDPVFGVPYGEIEFALKAICGLLMGMFVRGSFRSGFEIHFDDHQFPAVSLHLSGNLSGFKNIQLYGIILEKQIVHFPTSFIMATIVLTISPKFETIQNIFKKGAKAVFVKIIASPDIVHEAA
jgi:hypothetical protein